MIEVLLQNEPYRYVEMEELLGNGRYNDMYLCDNFMQMQTAMDDLEYTKWLDPAGVPCYVHDV